MKYLLIALLMISTQLHADPLEGQLKKYDVQYGISYSAREENIFTLFVHNNEGKILTCSSVVKLIDSDKNAQMAIFLFELEPGKIHDIQFNDVHANSIVVDCIE